MYPNSTNGGRGGVVYYGLLGSKICEFMIILLSDTSRPSEKNGNTIFSLEGNLEGLKYYNNKSWSDPNASTVPTSPWNLVCKNCIN